MSPWDALADLGRTDVSAHCGYGGRGVKPNQGSGCVYFHPHESEGQEESCYLVKGRVCHRPGAWSLTAPYSCDIETAVIAGGER